MKVFVFKYILFSLFIAQASSEEVYNTVVQKEQSSNNQILETLLEQPFVSKAKTACESKVEAAKKRR